MSPDPPRQERRLKTPAHTLDRVRNNQRRHRARRREYIASLEEKLRATEASLAEALAEIAGLKAELASYRDEQPIEASIHDGSGIGTDRIDNPHIEVYGTHDAAEEIPEAGLHLISPTAEAAVAHEMLPIAESSTSTAVVRELSPPDETPLTMISSLTPIHYLGSSNAPSTAFFASTLGALSFGLNQTNQEESAMIPHFSIEQHPAPDHEVVPSDFLGTEDCCLYLPSSNSESTTLCSQAYNMIQQQNFRGIDINSIQQWLWVGFRCGKSAGEGCRVENRLLFALLDFISGV